MSQINFLPPSYLRRRKTSQRSRIHAVAMGVLLTLLAGLWVVDANTNAALAGQAEALDLEREVAELQRAEIAQLNAEAAAMRHAASIHEELGQPISHTQVINAMGATLPESVTLTRLSIQTLRPPALTVEQARKAKEGIAPSKKGKSEAPPADRLEVTLEALSPDDVTVANMVASLTEHPLFSKVIIRYSRAVQWDGVHARQFELSMWVTLDRPFQSSQDKEVADAR